MMEGVRSVSAAIPQVLFLAWSEVAVAVEVEVEVWPSLRDLLKPVRRRLSHLPASLQPHIVASWRS